MPTIERDWKYADERPTVMLDTECLLNYWMIGFMNVDTYECVQIEMYDGKPLDRRKIANILAKYRVVSANGLHYDMPMIQLAMKEETTNADLKRANDDIIVGQMRYWDFKKKWKLNDLPGYVDHIDPWEVDPGSPQRQSMKIRGARVHCETVMEMPIHHDAWVTPDDRPIILKYNRNDLKTQIVWFKELKSQIELRARMSDEFGVDLRSKSDAQMAEAIMKVELERVTGRTIYKPDEDYKNRVSKPFYYEPPAHITFKTKQLQDLLEEIKKTEFTVSIGKKGKRQVKLPPNLDGRQIVINQGIYTLGLGGLHSCEESITWIADELIALIDCDVASYYPSIILNNELFPRYLGREALRVYLRLFERRLRAKGMGLADIAETLKIVLNGWFGKTGSEFAIAFDPKVMIQITLTGQLDILMVIEDLETRGFQVISANTDGFVTRVPRDQRGQYNAIILDWELATNFGTEKTEYLAVHSRDVNCYAAITKDPKTGKVSAKLKGNIGPCGPGLKGASGLKKNPVADISSRAAVAFLTHKTPIEKTINECDDVRHFAVVRKSTEVVFDGNDPVGKALRWYYSVDKRGQALMSENVRGRARNENAAEYKQVPKSEGAAIMLTLPDFYDPPADLDREWYIREAYAILQDVGYGAFDPGLAGSSGLFLGTQPKQKTLHYVRAETGVSLCDKQQKSIRDPWKEYGAAPTSMRICKKCREARGMEEAEDVVEQS